MSINGRKVVTLWYETIMARQMELDMLSGDGKTSEQFDDYDWARVAVAFNRKLKHYMTKYVSQLGYNKQT